MKKGTILKEGAIYGIGGILSRFTGLITVPVYTRFLSVSEFGSLDFYLTLSTLLYLFAEFQLLSGVMRGYTSHREGGTLSDLFGSSLTIYTLIYGLLLAGLFTVTKLFTIDFVDAHSVFLVPVILGIGPKLIVQMFLIELRMSHQAWHYLLVSVFTVLFAAGFGIFYVTQISASIIGILWGFAFSSGVMAVYAFGMLMKRRLISMSTKYIKEITFYGAPLLPTVISSWAMTSLNRMLIVSFLGVYFLGIYSLAFKIASLYVFFTRAFYNTWQPYANKLYNDKGSEHVFVKVLRGYVLIGSTIVALMMLFSRQLVLLLGTEAYIDSQVYIPFILYGMLIEGVTLILGAGNNWARKTYYNSYGALSGFALNIALLVSLIYQVELFAVAISYIVGQFVRMLVVHYTSQRSHPISFDVFNIVLYLTFLVAVGATTMLNIKGVVSDLWIYFLAVSIVMWCIIQGKSLYQTLILDLR